MSPDEFRRAGHELIDWIASYLEHPERHPVLARVAPGQLIDSLPPSAPENGEPIERILDDFRDLVLPGITHWNHPGFMAYFATSASGPAILAELLTAALNANGMLWKTSPAVTELEQVTLSWLAQWLGLPASWFGIIFDTASTSSMHAIAAARHQADPEARLRGGLPQLTMYTSEQCHSSIEKGAIALGIGQRNVRRIGVDRQYRMSVPGLTEAIQADLDVGKQPFCVTATVGTTSTTSVDPVSAIADVAERYGLWLHLDAAYAGPAAILPEFRHILDGAGRADSLVVNPHKWLFNPVDLSVLYTRKPDVLRGAFSLVPEYLQTASDPRAINFMDYGVPLGRRFRSLKLWFVLRHFGREGVAKVLRDHIRWAAELAGNIDADPDFERVAPAQFSVVCFRLKADDAANRELLEAVNAGGEFYLSHTSLHGRFVLRLAIGNLGTTREHVQRAWRVIKSCAERICSRSA
jgi:aromatic-L-amino-acid/L-tryptophan decarboxylase